jgi:hypothetical protein
MSLTTKTVSALKSFTLSLFTQSKGTKLMFTKTDLFLIPLISRHALVVVPAMVRFDEITAIHASHCNPAQDQIDESIDACQSLAHHLLGHKTHLDRYMERAQHPEVKAVIARSVLRMTEILLLINQQIEYFTIERLTVGMESELQPQGYWRDSDHDSFHVGLPSNRYH